MNKQINAILDKVGIEYGVSVLDIIGNQRSYIVVKARHEAMLSLSETGLTYDAIAKELRKNKSTVKYGLRCAKRKRDSDDRSIKYLIEGLEIERIKLKKRVNAIEKLLTTYKKG